MGVGFKYNIDLPETLDAILDQDFWVIDNVRPAMLQSLSEPVKFAANTWIFVKSGSCHAEISLISHKIKGPAFVSIRRSQFLMPSYISPDFEAAVVVMSKRFEENLFLLLSDSTLYTMMNRHVWVPMPEEVAQSVTPFVAGVNSILADRNNPYGGEALVFDVASYVFRSLYKCYEPFKNEITSNKGRMANKFLALVQENYKKERFLDFYASKLDITPKHLSRTIKSQTGFTAVEWIERFVILEAKVLIKSTNLNIQQIADELNFPSQSFFGKYFKKYTGMSPKEFRNS
ncbi:MAG: helix-turn-helix domain-containing protein [Muribaculaceae bacterium]|nr:helix-turn-helix domain-containing protein [Muribaculaceae bacterium]